MQTVQFLVFLFVLAVGKTPKDQREFARIAGTWHVVGMEANGKPVDSKAWQGKRVVFRASAESVKQSPEALLYTGSLNTQHKPPVIETHSITMIPAPRTTNQGKTSRQTLMPAKVPVDFYILYEVHGDKMKLLMMQIINKTDPRPTQVRSAPNSRAVLFTLQRKG